PGFAAPPSPSRSPPLPAWPCWRWSGGGAGAEPGAGPRSRRASGLVPRRMPGNDHEPGAAVLGEDVAGRDRLLGGDQDARITEAIDGDGQDRQRAARPE